MTLESTDGFVRVVARRDNHRIVGWQAVAATHHTQQQYSYCINHDNAGYGI